MSTTSQIQSIESYIPNKTLTNQYFEEHFDWPLGTIKTKTGLLSRRHADKNEHPTKMGVEVARKAIQKAGFDPHDIDMIISASGSRDQGIPPDAMIYAHLLDIPDVQCFHEDAVCMSFVNALEIADLYIKSGKREKILIITAEQCSRLIDYDDPVSSILLADGAVAALVTQSSGASRIEASYIKTEAVGNNINVATLKAGGIKHIPSDPDYSEDMEKFQVDGPLELKLALKYFPAFLDTLFAMADCTLDDIDHVFPHQVIPRMIMTILDKLGVATDKIHINPEYGNQAAASMPIGLAEGVTSGKVRRGDRVFLIGGAAGFTLGGTILIY